MCFIDISRRYLCCCYYLIGSVHCPMCLIPKLCLPTCPYYGCVRICCGYISTIYSSLVFVITFFIFPLFFQPLLQFPVALIQIPLKGFCFHNLVIRCVCFN